MTYARVKLEHDKQMVILYCHPRFHHRLQRALYTCTVYSHLCQKWSVYFPTLHTCNPFSLCRMLNNHPKVAIILLSTHCSHFHHPMRYSIADSIFLVEIRIVEVVFQQRCRLYHTRHLVLLLVTNQTSMSQISFATLLANFMRRRYHRIEPSQVSHFHNLGS